MRYRVLALALALSVLVPSGAPAHEGNPNYRSEISRIAPQIEGLEVEVVNFDDSLRLRNETGETVVVEGYEGEPYIRISPDGTVEINQDSPSFYLNQDRFAKAEVPASADPEAPPDWRVANESGEYAWHDHRIHYMGEGTPEQVEDESERTKVFDYSVPLTVGEQPVEVEGTLYWVGEDESFPAPPFIALGVLAAAAVAFVLWRRRRGDSDERKAEEVW